VDRDQIRLLARREVAAVLRRERRTWVHTVREEFSTYYPLADLTPVVRWRSFYPDRTALNRILFSAQAHPSNVSYGKIAHHGPGGRHLCGGHDPSGLGFEIAPR
jgi:hypothetical protein